MNSTPNHSATFLATLKAAVPGIVAAIGTLAILTAKSWSGLIIGWIALGVMALLILAGVLTRKPVTGAVRFRVGPPIAQSGIPSQGWLIPLGIAVFLLGLVGLLIPGDEVASPEKYGWSLFLMGAGIACFGIARNHRLMLAFGYLLWCIAGLVLIGVTIASPLDPISAGRLLTIGGMMAFGGGAASYSFFRGSTTIYEDGIVYGNGLCEWSHVDSWELIHHAGNHLLLLSVSQGKWKPAHHVSSRDVEDLRMFLENKVPDTSEADR
ncbi:MAG: hypothetical protein KDA80_00775 [Planctomycetaceae bacterium]|nr:hypothetical protein [Planctomycetaceae bacterium]